ncbi:hypothetical protein BJ165DRAFT_1400142 [Panaeolus papilionaceus]|nr:hypothetical protein BJ165DRAFT_1400142 [Panaeolus papilionaceus]
MSAMLESYDMQMHDYPTDIDIQMHPSSSDQWFHDEAKMEEDLPHRTDPSMKADQYDLDKTDFPIEVEMDSSLDPDAHVNEYEMLDGEFMHESGSTELVDVEVLDASLVHTPSVLPVEMHNIEPTTAPQYSLHDVTIPSEPSSVSIPQILPDNTPLTTLPATADFKEDDLPRLEADSTSAKLPEPYGISVAEVPSTPATISHEPNPAISSTEQEADNHAESLPQENPTEETTLNSEELQQHQLQAWSTQTGEMPPNPTPHAEDAQPEASSELVETQSALQPEEEEEITYNDIPDSSHVQHDETEHAPPQSTGDPHEISEGVFIEPPPPVIMSLPQTDLHVTFFTSSEGEVQEGTPVIFQHLPTLYYEPLPTVFEALRQESIIHNLPGVDEAELVMDILSLQLRISEDNIYSRDMSLHDLNVLHDAAGLSGSLHISTTTSTPRFIVQYHRLQESIHRSNPEEPTNPQHSRGPSDAPPPDTAQLLSEGSTEQTSEDVPKIFGHQDQQVTTALHDGEDADVENVRQIVRDADKQAIGANDHDGETEQDHDDERSESTVENEGDGTGNDVQEAPFDENSAIPEAEELGEGVVESVHQQETFDEPPSSHTTGEGHQIANTAELANVDEHVDDEDGNEDEENGDPGQDVLSGENDVDDHGSYEEDGEVIEDGFSGVDLHGEDLVENGEASSVEDEEESFYELGHAIEEPVTDVTEVIPLEALEPAEEDGSSEDHHTSTLGSRDTSPSSSGGHVRHSPDEEGEAVDKDNYDEEELHVGDEGYAVNDGNHNDSEAHLDETHNENQLVDSKDDLQKKVYFDQQDSAEGLLQADPDVPDLPDEPISFEDWDADGDFDYEEWDEGKDYSTTLSNNESTTTLSSKSSKRTFEEVENSENYGEWAPASSPDPKRTRTL